MLSAGLYWEPGNLIISYDVVYRYDVFSGREYMIIMQSSSINTIFTGLKALPNERYLCFYYDQFVCLVIQMKPSRFGVIV